jgi:hypothetical protein
MEINEFVSRLKAKYGYSDEMERFLNNAVPAIISYYGDDKKNVVFAALNECEIHIQRENENIEQYLNQYFGTNKKWDIPFLGGAFQHTELFINNGNVEQKNLIYIRREYLHSYTPFDFNDEKMLSGVIHELCHAIKGYGKISREEGKIVVSSGLIKDYYEYDSVNNLFINVKSDNTGFEEALNSYDEASIMSIMTGKFHEYGAYKGMTVIARELMKNDVLAQKIRSSQFSGGMEWIEFLGKEACEYLSQNFDDWVNVLYCSPADLMADKNRLMEKLNTARSNVVNFVTHYTMSQKEKTFLNSNEFAETDDAKMKL